MGESTYAGFRSQIASVIEREGCRIRDPQPLAHPELGTNFTMSLAVTLLPSEQVTRDDHIEDYGVIQPCIRVHDADQVVADEVPWHLSFFEMAGAIVDGACPRRRALEVLLHLCRQVIGVSHADLSFELFAGGGSFGTPKDTETQEILRRLGIGNERITFHESHFFGCRSGEKVAGPLVEVLVPGRDGGKQELATTVFLDYQQPTPGRLTPLEIPLAEMGVGVERALSIASKKGDLSQSEPLQALINCFPDLNPKQRLLVADRLRAVAFAVCAGVLPGRKGRGSVVRGFTRDLFAVESSSSWLDHLGKGVEQLVVDYGVFYPSLKPEEIMAVLRRELKHDEKRKNGKKA
ncbi:MAG: alanine--tRNA ligase-related protein [Kiritimatiellia bacterium]